MRNTKGLQYLINERLATRSGVIGRIFKGLEMGNRQYGTHRVHKVFRVGNYFWMMSQYVLALQRPVLSRFIGASNGPLNYSGLWLWFILTTYMFSTFRFIRVRDFMVFNVQDNPEFWYGRYNLMFPPAFLHQRISAHYIEINHIFMVEMFKKYQTARKEILDEREAQSDEVKRTKYATNPNYVYEPLGPDDEGLKRLKTSGIF